MLLIGRHLGHHAATIGVGIGAHEDVQLVEAPGAVRLPGDLPLEGLDGRLGRAGIARVGLLLAARLAGEGGKEAVEVVQPPFGDNLDVLVRQSDLAEQPRDRAAAGPVERAVRDPQRPGRLPFPGAEVGGHQERPHMGGVLPVDVHDRSCRP